MKKIYLKEFEIYKKSYQKSFLWTFIFSIIILIICFTASFFMADLFIKQTEEIADNIAGMSGKEISELSDKQTFLMIFLNNLKIGTMVILFGLVPFYRLSSFFAVLQFILIGVVFGGLYAMGHNVINAFVFSFLPHALIELTAFVYSVAIGNFINRNVLAKIFFRKKKDFKPISQLLKQSLRSYIFVVIPLLVVAAFIEAFITSRLSETFL